MVRARGRGGTAGGEWIAEARAGFPLSGLGPQFRRPLLVKAIHLWAERSCGEYVGIVLGPEDGDRGWGLGSVKGAASPGPSHPAYSFVG